MRARGLIPLLGLLALLASCVSAPRAPGKLDPLTCLDSSALAFARLDGKAALELAPTLLPPEESRSLAPLLERSQTIGLALIPGARPGADKGFEAVFTGSYPRVSANFALGSKKDWKRVGKTWRNEALGLSVALPSKNLVLVANSGIEALLDRAAAPLSSPLPPRLAGFADQEFLLWVPEPFDRLGSVLLGEKLILPVRGILITAAPAGSRLNEGKDEAGSAGSEESSYELIAAFLMENADAARIYRPALKVAWQLFVRGLLPGETGLLRAGFTQDGELIVAGGMRVSGASLATVLSRLRGLE